MGDTLIGAAALAAEYNGVEKASAVKDKLIEMTHLNETLFCCGIACSAQKGFDLVACVLDDLMSREDMQFMLLGTGDERFENFMRGAESRYRGRVCSYIGYNEDLAHLVYAGSDFFLMPINSSHDIPSLAG